ncbi:MAG: hypothetical protein AVDCRST_MAG64-2531 [uncultured Phycisphaerae bacterium]|uniref:Uncharacterized protein n=1 Tax=uncultured Phycisphaerae bacterium TaxID=904963 RepID=A0A6J4PMV5_9BACT|nr:MAG: hypothetical protein AVDCRST_MAG64-2531 [uncultured Phycisphaerae bacterium]
MRGLRTVGSPRARCSTSFDRPLALDRPPKHAGQPCLPA